MKTFSKKDTSIMKGVAIIMLMFHHNFGAEKTIKGMTVNFFPFSQDSVILFCNFLKICVGMFAFLSGYGLYLSLKKYNNKSLLNSRQYSHFVCNKLLNLMWGYWFVFIVAQIGSLIFSPKIVMKYFKNGGIRGIVNVFIDFLGIPRLIGSYQMNGTWWYMALAIVIIFAVPLMSKLNDKYNIFVTISLLILIPRIISLTEPLRIGETSNIFRFMFPALLGVLFAKYNWFARMKTFTITNNKVLSKLIKFVVLTIGLVFLYLVRVRTNGNYANYIFEIRDGLIPAYVIYYCYEFIADIPFLNSVLALIGKHSLNIFLFHTFIRFYWFRNYTYSYKYFLLIPIVLLVESLLISIIFEFIKKHTGYNKLCGIIRNKMNNKFFTDVQMNTAK